MKASALNCPECGVALIPATGRGRHDRDGNFVAHRDGCRCSWCDWVWFDDEPPVECKCGARGKVEIDDGAAYATEVQ